MLLPTRALKDLRVLWVDASQSKNLENKNIKKYIFMVFSRKLKSFFYYKNFVSKAGQGWPSA